MIALWYAVQVQTGRENAAKELCEKLMKPTDGKIFLIRFDRAKRYCGKWHRETELMFPGYFFVETKKPLLLYEKLKNIPRLTKMLGREEEEFLPIEEEKEALFRSMLNEKDEISISKGIIDGDNVIVTEGPLQGYEGMIKKINRHKRIAVLGLDLFGQGTDVTVGLEIVAKK